MQLAEFRKRFPVLEKLTYLDTPQRGLTPTVATSAACEVLQGWEGLDSESGRGLPKRVKQQLAKLLQVAPEEIALANSTGAALNAFAGALDWQPGDNVVLAAAEHASNFYPWLHLRQRGVEVRLVPCAGGIMRPDDYRAYIDSRTRVVAASLVSFYPGAMLDAQLLAEICHQAGALLVLDAIQAVGILPVYPRQLGADVVASAAYKGLMSAHGGGFLYVRKDLLPRLKPQQLYLGNTVGERGIMGNSYCGIDYAYVETAELLEQGAASRPVLAQMDTNLDLILGLGVENISQHVCSLAGDLVQGALRLGFNLDTPQEAGQLRHIVCLQMAKSPGYGAHLAAHLATHDIVVSGRRLGLRMGLHAYNTSGDIERILEVLAAYPLRC